MKSVLLLGAGGQLGRLVGINLSPEFILLSYPRDMLDITDRTSLGLVIEETQPDVVINCAAHTAVDKAEVEKQAAFDINAGSIENLVELLPEHTRIIHISTDFVFSDMSTRPYLPDDPVHPQSVYGKSKRAGELILLEKWAERSTIIRTSWLYAANGRNFVNTMLRLMNERQELRVASDQFGSPTAAEGLAKIIWGFARRDCPAGVYHWSDRGVITWFDFACEIQRIALDIGLLANKARLIPVSTSEYPVPAKRPVYSALDSSGTEVLLDVTTRPWKDQLLDVMKEIKGTL